MDDSVKLYEVGYLLNPLIAESSLGEEVAKIKAVAEGLGGVMVSGDDPKSIALSYPVCKVVSSKNNYYSNAWFGFFKFKMDPAKTSDLKTGLDKNDNILRYLLIKTTPDTVRLILPTAADATGETVPEVAKDAAAPASEETPAAPVAMNEQEIDKEIEGLLVGTE
ncbi:MAG: 30S ribosomal protein S6 [Candidatus Paceibacterota bacterium]|jgi:ribosomal protein S6